MKYFSKNKGFTLIELLVVIAIISILTAIVTSNFTQSKAKARDAKRVSDLAQIALTLEMAFDRCNAYPSAILINTAIKSGCKDNNSGVEYTMAYFISKMPTAPLAGETYDYVPNANFTDYVLRAKLETNSSVLLDDMDGTILTTVDCDDTSPKYYCVVAK